MTDIMNAKNVGNRFLYITDDGEIPCPDCEAEIDYEIGPDEVWKYILDTCVQLLTSKNSKVKKKSKKIGCTYVSLS